MWSGVLSLAGLALAATGGERFALHGPDGNELRFREPFGIAADDSGAIYIIDKSAREMVVADPASGRARKVPLESRMPRAWYSLVAARRGLYAFTDDELIAISPEGRLKELVGPSTGHSLWPPELECRSGAGGEERGGICSGGLCMPEGCYPKKSELTEAARRAAERFRGIHYLAKARGSLYALGKQGSLKRIDPATGTVEEVGPFPPQMLSDDSDALAHPQARSGREFMGDCCETETLAGDEHEFLYVAGNDAVCRIDPKTMTTVTVAGIPGGSRRQGLTPFSAVRAMAPDDHGRLFILGEDKLSVVSLETHEVRTVASFEPGPGARSDPHGIFLRRIPGGTEVFTIHLDELWKFTVKDE